MFSSAMSMPVLSQPRRQIPRGVDRVVGQDQKRDLALPQARDERIRAGDRVLLADEHAVHVHQVGPNLALAGHAGNVAVAARAGGVSAVNPPLGLQFAMLAAICETSGGTAALSVREVETPAPGPDEVRVKVAISGVNPTDWKTRRRSTAAEGAFVVPNQDGAGTIDAVGPGDQPEPRRRARLGADGGPPPGLGNSCRVHDRARRARDPASGRCLLRARRVTRSASAHSLVLPQRGRPRRGSKRADLGRRRRRRPCGDRARALRGGRTRGRDGQWSGEGRAGAGQPAPTPS